MLDDIAWMPVVGGVYLLGAVVAWCLGVASGLFYEKDLGRMVTGLDLLGISLLAVLSALVWPLVLLATLIERWIVDPVLESERKKREAGQ